MFLGLHGAMLFSIPPVLRRRGAPYLPTFQRDADSLFQIIRIYCTKNALYNPSKPQFKFIDLGSGDGRLVFRAAREHLFRTCIGYEINPGM